MTTYSMSLIVKFLKDQNIDFEFHDANVGMLFYHHGCRIDISPRYKKKQFNGGVIPNIFENESEDIENTLYVNAWDPWSIIGNGNGGDRSLDGCWGRCSNMSVLGWSVTNPTIQYIPV